MTSLNSTYSTRRIISFVIEVKEVVNKMIYPPFCDDSPNKFRIRSLASSYPIYQPLSFDTHIKEAVKKSMIRQFGEAAILM